MTGASVFQHEAKCMTDYYKGGSHVNATAEVIRTSAAPVFNSRWKRGDSYVCSKRFPGGSTVEIFPRKITSRTKRYKHGVAGYLFELFVMR